MPSSEHKAKLTPSVIYPWEQLVRLCKKYGVISLVDGAHSIGQHKVDLAQVDPDFFVSVSDIILAGRF